MRVMNPWSSVVMPSLQHRDRLVYDFPCDFWGIVWLRATMFTFTLFTVSARLQLFTEMYIDRAIPVKAVRRPQGEGIFIECHLRCVWRSYDLENLYNWFTETLHRESVHG